MTCESSLVQVVVQQHLCSNNNKLTRAIGCVCLSPPPPSSSVCNVMYCG